MTGFKVSEELSSKIKHYNLTINQQLIELSDTKHQKREELIESIMLTTEARNECVRSLLKISAENNDITERQGILQREILESVTKQDKVLIELFANEQKEVKEELLKFRKNTTRINSYNTHKSK